MRIASRYRPFSHQAGTSLLIPGSSVLVTAYPTCLVVCAHDATFNLRWTLTGIIKQFTILQDLENHNINISGFAQEGYFRYILSIRDKKLVVKLDRGPKEGVGVAVEKKGSLSETSHLLLKQELCLHRSLEATQAFSCTEKISFGVSKSQDWDYIRRRQEPLEYLPFWFSLGQSLDFFDKATKDKPLPSSSLNLLDKAFHALEHKEPQLVVDTLHQIFLTSFHSLLVPSTYDCNFQGLCIFSKTFDEKDVNLNLLYQGYLCIRQLLVCVKEQTIHILNYLPASFHSGRAINFSLPGAMLDIDWSKKQLKKMTLTVFDKQTFLFSFQKDLKTFRLKRNSEKKGAYLPCSKALSLEPGMYTFDQFRK